MLEQPKSRVEVLTNVGYEPNYAKHPARIMKQVGFKAAMAQLGLTEELVASSLSEDIKEKPQNRVRELSLAADILGMKKAPEDTNKDNKTYNFFFNSDIQAKIKPYEDELKNLLKNAQSIETTAIDVEDEE